MRALLKRPFCHLILVLCFGLSSTLSSDAPIILEHPAKTHKNDEGNAVPSPSLPPVHILKQREFNRSPLTRNPLPRIRTEKKGLERNRIPRNPMTHDTVPRNKLERNRLESVPLPSDKIPPNKMRRATIRGD